MSSRDWGEPEGVTVRVTGMWNDIRIRTSGVRSKGEDHSAAAFDTVMLICLLSPSYPVSFKSEERSRPVGEFLLSNSLLSRLGNLNWQVVICENGKTFLGT